MRFAVVALAFAGVGGALPAAAFECTRAGGAGPSLAWGPRQIVMQRSGDGAEIGASEIERVLEGAADTWNGVACSDVELSVGSPTDDQLAGFDWRAGVGSEKNHNILVFRNDSPTDPLDEWLHQLGALAITTVTFESNEGRLLDADIEINDVGFPFTSCDPGDCTVDFDLQNTLTHELGHVLGLDHSAIGAATMFASAPRGDVSKRSLEGDDEAAVCTVYPAGEPVGECFGVGRESPPNVRFTEVVCGAGGSAAPVAAFGALWLLLAPGARRVKAGRARRNSVSLDDDDERPADLPRR